MPPLRVLEVSKATGGLGTYIRWLAASVDPSQAALTFACLSSGSKELADELARVPGVTAHAWPMSRYRLAPVGDSHVAFRLARLIRTRGFHVVHGHGSKAGLIARIAAAGSGVPVVYSPHGFAFHAGQPPWRAAVYAYVERLAARSMTAKIVTVSDAERASALAAGVGLADQIVTVHSGVDPSAYARTAAAADLKAALGVPRDARLIGTVGRLSEQKGPLDFVRVAARVQRGNPEARMLWIGDGRLEGEARRLAAELGVDATVHFAGHRSDVPALLGAMDVFVMTSRWESLPLALLEAMASGLPIVATRLPGIAEAVEDGVSGLLRPVGDIEGLSAAIGSILVNGDLASRLGAAARRRIEREFTRERMIGQLLRVYEDVARRRILSRNGPRAGRERDDRCGRA